MLLYFLYKAFGFRIIKHFLQVAIIGNCLTQSLAREGGLYLLSEHGQALARREDKLWVPKDHDVRIQSWNPRLFSIAAYSVQGITKWQHTHISLGHSPLLEGCAIVLRAAPAFACSLSSSRPISSITAGSCRRPEGLLRTHLVHEGSWAGLARVCRFYSTCWVCSSCRSLQGTGAAIRPLLHLGSCMAAGEDQIQGHHSHGRTRRQADKIPLQISGHCEGLLAAPETPQHSLSPVCGTALERVEGLSVEPKLNLCINHFLHIFCLSH